MKSGLLLCLVFKEFVLGKSRILCLVFTEFLLGISKSRILCLVSQDAKSIFDRLYLVKSTFLL